VSGPSSVADPDPFHTDLDPDPAFQFETDPDRDPTVLDRSGSLPVHRQNVEVTNAEWTQRRTTKRRMGQNAECQNVE
jgi:hypothetical protein